MNFRRLWGKAAGSLWIFSVKDLLCSDWFKKKSMDSLKKSSALSLEETKKEPTKKSFFHIDRDMIRFKIHFFLFIGAMGAVLPYLPIVARNRIGLSATSLAVVLSSQQLLGVITKPVIGYITDYFNKLKLIIITLIIIQAIAFFLVIAVPPIKKSSHSRQQLLETYDFNNYDGEQYLINMITARYSKSSNFEGDTMNDTLDIRYMNIICINLINVTDAFCFMYETNEEIIEKELNCSCSFLEGKNFSDIIKVQSWKQNVRLISLEPDLLYDSNGTFACTIANDEESSDINDFETLEFWMFAIVTTITSTCITSGFTLGDTACFETVEKVKGDFGKQRLFGAVGWGTFAVISGFLCDTTGDYVAAWLLMAVLKIFAIWNISKLNLVKPHFSQNLLKDVGKVLKSLEFVAFEWGIFFNGMGAGIIWFYLVWFLTGLGASTFLCGLVQYIQNIIGEIPFMYFSGWFLQKLGHFNLISLALFSYALRFLWYSYLQNPWLVLPAEIAHGFTYGTFYPTVASYGKKSAKPGTEATTQSILFTTHEGLGAGLGCILAGIGFDVFGGHQTFFYFSLMGFCATIFNVVNTLFLNRRSSEVLDISPPTPNQM